MVHLFITLNIEGYTPIQIWNMTRNEFNECPLPHYVKVCLLKQYLNERLIAKGGKRKHTAQPPLREAEGGEDGILYTKDTRLHNMQSRILRQRLP